MAEIIRMPEVLAGAAEAAIQTWLVSPGARVSANDVLAEIETDKAIVEFSSEFDGIVGRMLAAEGDSVAVGDPILVLLGAGESDDTIDVALAAAAAETRSSQPDLPERVEPAAPTADQEPVVRRFASPLVRRMAAQHGLDIAALVGTGPGGRIVRRDLERHLDASRAAATAERATEGTAAASSDTAPSAAPVVAPAPPAAAPLAGGAPYEDIPLDRMRKAIARRLTESKTTVPHFYLVADCRVDALLALRAEINRSSPRKISVNDLVIKAVAAAMIEVPAANAVWNTDSLRRYSTVDLAVAVATDGGLVTPVLRSVERMSLTEVSATVADLAERARAGRVKQHELEGGSFAVSNLGMYGTDSFSAILNPPQSGILAVGAARRTPVVDTDGELIAASIMTVTLSADHRVLDGAVAAQWLAAFRRRIESPLTIVI